MESPPRLQRCRFACWLGFLAVAAAGFSFFTFVRDGDFRQAAVDSLVVAVFFAAFAAAIALPYIVASRFGAFSYAELEQFQSGEDRDNALREAVGTVTSLIAAPGFMLLVCCASAFLMDYLATPEPWRTVIFSCTFLAIFWSPLPVILLRRHRGRLILRRHLRSAGVPICLRCGYRLHGLNAKVRCPECGDLQKSA